MSKLVQQLEDAQRHAKRAGDWGKFSAEELFPDAIAEAMVNTEMDPTDPVWSLVISLEQCIANAKEALRLVRTAK